MPVFDIQTLHTPSSEDQELARIFGQTLADYGGQPLSFPIGQRGRACKLPTGVVKLLTEIMQAMGDGQSLVVVPMESNLTVPQAAEILDVSVPYMTELLVQGDISYQWEEGHRVVQLRDLLEYERRTAEERKAVLAELVAEGQRLNMGY